MTQQQIDGRKKAVEETEKQIADGRAAFELMATGIVLVARCIGGAASTGPESLVRSSQSIAKAYIDIATDEMILEFAK